ncbi:hypothetical protein AAW14_18030 [Streptomyces hygroscopicus]|uniref:hypothetical protein n=1 Tax=Streptomyces hygroscopicus TaxID=1912 RepID=UPI0022409750|nr:hypothetical protein [Streptomyces hygroscopicus]MCW7943893.1 hypothetical protein [Streptomyces hygroscopicus]
MQRTTTTATLLVTVAVSALTGCVTVQRPAVPGPPSSTPSALRPDGSAQPRVVQAPAREALEMVQSSAEPSPTVATPHRPPRTAPGVQPAATPARPVAHAHDRQAHPRTHPMRARPGTRIEVPPAVAEAFPRNGELCALGRTYGGWRPDSPEAVICRSTYGR